MPATTPDHPNSPPDAATPKAPPDKRATLRRIAEAARREFAAKGLANARVDDIALAAGVTKQLVYHYFRSKEELFVSVLDASSADTMHGLVALELDHLPPRAALRALLNHMIDPYRDPTLSSLAQEGIRFHENHATPRNSFIELAPELQEKMRRILARGAANGDFRADLDADLVLTAAALATTSAFVSRYTVSTLSGLDVGTKDDAETWRRFSVEFVMSAVERERSGLPTLTRTAIELDPRFSAPESD